MPQSTIVNANVENDAPEVAISAFLKKIQESLSRMKMPTARSKLYNEEIESLRNLYQPKVTVAICGATGAGKSSLLNAILDADIVPTSSVRACTAVVTQLSWNRESERIAADVEFLTRAEWIEELVILLSDLADPANERVKHASQLVGASATAWAKVHAVCPGVSLQTLMDMDADGLMLNFPHISQLLGTSARVEASDTEEFRRVLEPYLDCREHANHQALWPLIRHVKIFCRSAALSTGLTLVDLPGTADTNAARDRIAKDYLKICDHCWIVSPITRAVSDKVASELLGHMFRLQLKLDGKLSSGNGITFIATKSEDIKPSEVIKNLNLDEDIEFHGLTGDLALYQQELARWNNWMQEANVDAESIRKQITQAKDKLDGYCHDLRVFHAGDGGRAKQSHVNGLPQSTLKRKYFSMFSTQEQKEPTKRKRQRANNVGVTNLAPNPGLSKTGQENVVNQAPSPDPGITGSGMSAEELESSIHDVEQYIQQLNNELFDITDCQQNISLGRDRALEDVEDTERAIRAFCAAQRAEYSRHRLREDFRSNLEECAVDEIGQEDLPVFVVSSWDYMSLRADKPPACFSTVEQTEIPALQDWCHASTLPARNETARILATQFRAFTLVLKTFLEGADGVTERDRNNMQRKWASSSRKLALYKSNPRREMRRATITPTEHLRGITVHLLMSFNKIVEDTVEDLQRRFTEYLQDDCNEGADSAAGTAVDTSKECAQMIWQKYRAFLRRDGCYEEYDLNTQLTIPFVSHISQNWCKLFQSNLFGVLETATVQAVEELVDQVVRSVPEYLTSRARKQGEVALEQTRAFLVESVSVVQRALDEQQRTISRKLAPHVQEQLKEGYQNALLITGPGTTSDQKEAVHDYIDEKKDEVFCGAAEVLMGDLDDAAKAIGEALEVDLTRLSMTVENTIAILWEGPLEDDKGVKTRVELMRLLDKAIAQADDWLTK